VEIGTDEKNFKKAAMWIADVRLGLDKLLIKKTQIELNRGV
jgi:hypothetical protein